jgi:virulence-associated protein VagC
MNLSTRSTRTVAAVGAVVAAGTATFMAVAAGTASADEPGHCLQNVNVREEADVNSRIVAMCEAGTQVTIGPEKEGWAYLENLRGWASRDFIKADQAAAPAAPAAGTSGAAADSSDSSSSATESASSSSSERAPSDEAAGDRGSSEGDSNEGDSRDGANSGSEAERPGGPAGAGGEDVAGLLR